MRKTLRRLLKDDSGSVIVLVTLGMVALIACMALVIDAGVVYAGRMKASNAVDAAVLAGVRELPGDPVAAQDIAEYYLQLNGVDPEADDVTFNISEDCHSITVEVMKEHPMHFARILGINVGEVKAYATARVGAAGSLPPNVGVAPLAVLQDEVVFGEVVTIKDGAGDGTQGWYGCLDLLSLTGGNGGAADYGYYLSHGYDGTGYISYGTLVLEEPGVMSGPTLTGISYRIDKCKNECDRECTAEDHDPNCPRIIIVIVGGLHDKKYFEVQSFAGFFLSDVPGNGVDSTIQGQFVSRDVIGAEIGDAVVDNGVHTMELSE